MTWNHPATSRPTAPPRFPPPGHRGDAPGGPPAGPPPPLGPPPALAGPSPAPPAGGVGGARQPGRRPPTGAIVAVAALLGAVIVAGLLVLLTGEDDAEVVGPAATTVPTDTLPPLPTTPEDPPATEAPPSTEAPPGTQAPPVEPVACPAEVPGPICDAADYVQRETGRAFRQFPVVELADEGVFQERLLADYEEGVEDLEALERTYVALGLLEPDVDLGAVLRDLYEVSVLGFYDSETDELVVRGADFTPLTRITIVHELVHALDDQWYELYRPEYDERDDEIAFGFSSIIEGHARVIETRYRSRLSPAEQAEAQQEELQLVLGSDIDIFAIPEVLLEVLGAPYELGQPLVEAILASGGTEALASAFAEPPTTSEQVLHPDRYLAGEAPVAVPPPPADGEVVDEGVAGEYGLILLLGAPDAAQGWGGDAYVTWTDGATTCTRIDLVADGPAELGPLVDAVSAWAGRGEGRTVEPTPVAGGDGVRFTACVG